MDGLPRGRSRWAKDRRVLVDGNDECDPAGGRGGPPCRKTARGSGTSTSTSVTTQVGERYERRLRGDVCDRRSLRSTRREGLPRPCSPLSSFRVPYLTAAPRSGARCAANSARPVASLGVIDPANEARHGSLPSFVSTGATAMLGVSSWSPPGPTCPSDASVRW